MGASEQTHSFVNSNQTGNDTAPKAIERWLVEQLLNLAGRPPLTVELWDGTKIKPYQTDLTARLHRRRVLYRMLRNPSIGFGDSYADGSLSIKGDLLTFLEGLYRSVRDARRRGGVQRLLRHLQAKRPRPNSLSAARENIHSHYDLGNDFYRLWLDDGYMQYTCAYYPDPGATLEQAQIAKMNLVCRKLNLKPGERVAEAGSGWGGLARYMARQHGVRVRSYNISAAQIAYARHRARQDGLDGMIEYIEDDYRNLTGEYDAFVSVGMLEHVGVEHYAALGKVVDGCLKDGGRGLIHTIGRNQPRRMDDWIESRVFPGAYPPTLGEMMPIFEPNDFSIVDVENLGRHYARTLTHWLQRYELNFDTVREMFDPAFARAWRLYLAGSIAAFTTGGLQLFQVLFQRPESNALPQTRNHLYADAQ